MDLWKSKKKSSEKFFLIVILVLYYNAVLYSSIIKLTWDFRNQEVTLFIFRKQIIAHINASIKKKKKMHLMLRKLLHWHLK